MNARQRRNRVRRDGYRVTKAGYVRMVGEADPTIYRETGQLYTNTRDGLLRVTVGGKWMVTPSEKDAMRLVEKFLKERLSK